MDLEMHQLTIRMYSHFTLIIDIAMDFEEVLSRYREIVPNLKLAGPTSFAPIIEMAMTVVEQSRGQYHVLVIIADGQVYFLYKANQIPLSIVLVGVGDGPWDTMKEFDDNIPAREFDNFPDSAPSAPPSSTFEHQICPICLNNPKDMAFGCGHQTCYDCGQDLQLCPICRSRIETRIKLY
ncbi:hypothetical protein RD792_016576 [Penstemon davidsonii]|uniref:RING-type domain-containing protein n=1 Tax=Penstemon davidsonii TaxID=160366 RepID=A0ABR0CKY5_9LAMI|nr:hypothetical protein RD792_016576 [Penstemon davidsonii]